MGALLTEILDRALCGEVGGSNEHSLGQKDWQCLRLHSNTTWQWTQFSSLPLFLFVSLIFKLIFKSSKAWILTLLIMQLHNVFLFSDLQSPTFLEWCYEIGLSFEDRNSFCLVDSHTPWLWECMMNWPMELFATYQLQYSCLYTHYISCSFYWFIIYRMPSTLYVPDLYEYRFQAFHLS